MWCAKCQADVAAIASADNQRARCSTCGTELLVAPGAEPNGPIARDPQELLARWAHEDASDPLHSLPPLSAERDDHSATHRRRSQGKPAQRRFDGQHPLQPVATLANSAVVANRVDAPPPVPPAPPVVASNFSDPSGREAIVHSSHAVAGNPHVEAAALLSRRKKSDRGSRWVTLVGQLAAYLGVGTLTVGASMVLMAYFGGPENYAPTGWLVTTAGQMLLFLGVVTLVSGGMEQTTQEVTDRIDNLGAHILRMEEYRAMKSEKESKTDAA